jgi:hypothetical protein
MQDQLPTTPGQNVAMEPTVSPVEPPSAATPAATVPVAPVTPVKSKPAGSRILNLALAGALVLAIAGVAFAVGRFTAPATASAGGFQNGNGGQFFRNGQGGQGGQGGGNGGQGGPGGLFAGGLTLEGTVESVTDTTLTLKTASGQTIQIALSGSTTYHAQTDATASAVTTGGKVLVRLNGRGGFFGGNGGPAASGAPTSPTANDVTVVP